MVVRVPLRDLESHLSEVTYPISREEAIESYGDTILVLADGDVTLGEILADSSADRFGSTGELTAELMQLLPQRAVGEPYQSDGDA